MLGLFLVSIITFTDAASVLFKGDPLVIKPCNEGVTIENECNKCVCSENHVYACSSKYSDNCSDITQNNSSCHPNVIHVLNDTMCICNSSGHWPHEKCNKMFRSLEPPRPQMDCKPNSYVRNDCNVCRCGPDGKLDEARCTRNKCKKTKGKNNFSKIRRMSNNVYGNCEVKNWYSLAPCQFCFCVNENKLVCNTGNAYSHKLELGAYNLSVCGKELIREAVELIPELQQALRDGINNITNEETTTETVTAKELLHENHVTINVSHEEGNLKFNMNNNHENNEKQDDIEYYTDSEEEKPSIKGIGREAPSIPQYSNANPNVLSDERKESEQEFETDNEMGVEIEAEAPKQVDKILKQIELSVPASSNQQLASVQTLTENFNLSEALKLNLPMVLDKVFQMALRKSMVSVDTESKCTPGAATILKCNVCFCLKEFKLLCTNNVCK